MSVWYEPKKEDIDFSDDFTELHIYIAQDDFGAIYTSIKLQDLIEILKENEII